MKIPDDVPIEAFAIVRAGGEQNMYSATLIHSDIKFAQQLAARLDPVADIVPVTVTVTRRTP